MREQHEDAHPRDAVGSAQDLVGSAEHAGRPRPAPSLLALAAILSIEAVGVLALAVLLAVDIATQAAYSMLSSIALLVTVAVAGLLLVVLARATWRRRPWIRGAAITWQVLQIAASWAVIEGDMEPWIGWVGIVLGLAGIACAVLPATQASLLPREGAEPVEAGDDVRDDAA